MLTFEQIVTGVQTIVKGYQLEKMQESVNMAQVQYASDFFFESLKQVGYLSDNGDETYTIYEETTFVTPSRVLYVTDPGVVNSAGKPVDFRMDRDLVRTEDGVAGYEVHYVRLPVFLEVLDPTDTNLGEESDWSEPNKQALVSLIASFLYDRKKDKENAKYYYDKYRLLYGPTSKHLSSITKGMSSLPAAKTSLNRKALSWI